MFSSLNSTISGRVAGGKPFAAGESEDPQTQTDVALVKTRWRLGVAGLPQVETRSYLWQKMRGWLKRGVFSKNSESVWRFFKSLSDNGARFGDRRAAIARFRLVAWRKGSVMATRIDVEYDRQHTNADIQEIVARATVTVNVLQQLGAAYQSLPGMGMAGYQTEVDAIEADTSALSALINQILPLLVSLDAKAGPLNDKNKKALKTLSGLLQTSAEKTLLNQITGPTAQSGGGTPTPPTP